MLDKITYAAVAIGLLIAGFQVSRWLINVLDFYVANALGLAVIIGLLCCFIYQTKDRG